VRNINIVPARREYFSSLLFPLFAGLMDRDVPLLAVDMPHPDRFRLHLEAVIAEDERRRIRDRTKGPPGLANGGTSTM
jgi:hypothetical protein